MVRSTLGAGFTTWPPDRNLVGAQRDQAADIFAFDTLIQNPDRRAVNPNLWARSDKLGVYDHEQAFSFIALPIIGEAPKPWQAAKQPKSFQFLEQHMFYRSLRGGRLDFGPFKEKLGRLTDGQIQGYAAAIPAAWHRSQYDFIDGFARHIRDALPKASFIGFTGTPIESGDKNTQAVLPAHFSDRSIVSASAGGDAAGCDRSRSTWCRMAWSDSFSASI